MAKEIRAALIGYGGMGHFHASCYPKQQHVKLVAVCDCNPEKFKEKKAEINLGESGDSSLKDIATFGSYEELCRGIRFDMLDICLPCHLHAEYAIRAMRDGYHVLCEKPMARTVAQADRMIRVSRETGRKLMIAQCIRFSPAYRFLKEIHAKKKYGQLLRLDMRRNSTLPKTSWYRDPAKSGGALLDLHLHDTDFINSLLGVPEAVYTQGIERDTGGIDDLMSSYYFAGETVVNSEGSWCKGKWFCSGIAVFRKATLEIINDTQVNIYRTDRKTEEVRFDKDTNPYFNEIAYFADCIRKKTEPEQCMPKSTRDSIRIAAAEERSARTKRKVRLPHGRD